MESGFFVAIVPVPGSNPTQEELDDMIDVSLFQLQLQQEPPLQSSPTFPLGRRCRWFWLCGLWRICWFDDQGDGCGGVKDTSTNTSLKVTCE